MRVSFASRIADSFLAAMMFPFRPRKRKKPAQGGLLKLSGTQNEKPATGAGQRKKAGHPLGHTGLSMGVKKPAQCGLVTFLMGERSPTGAVYTGTD